MNEPLKIGDWVETIFSKRTGQITSIEPDGYLRLSGIQGAIAPDRVTKLPEPEIGEVGAWSDATTANPLADIEHARQQMADSPTPTTVPVNAEYVCDLPNGCALFRRDNGGGSGYVYISDEVGGGVVVWDTCLVNEETLIVAIAMERYREKRIKSRLHVPTQSPDLIPIAKVFNVPRSHVDDFNKHPGWWATMDDPGLVAGDLIVFDLGGFEFVKATVISAKKEYQDQEGFQNWYIIRYAIQERKTAPFSVGQASSSGS